MSTSQGVNVLRWSALVFGVFYGFSHQRTINASDAIKHKKAAYDHQADLITKAKAEWQKKSQPAETKSSGSDVISDTSDKNFDLGAYISSVEAK